MNTKLELTIKNTEQRCKLTDLDINVNITGFLSKTSVTMTFLNETDLDSEGELVFPMPEGAAISGYAVDINGDLVDGVVVEKEKARITFEAEARSVEKPSASIVEHVVGNVFRTRITPLPKKATRIIRVSYVEELTPIPKTQQNRSTNKNKRDVQWKLSFENIGPLNTLAMNAIIAGGGAPRARWDGNTVGSIKPLPDVIGPVAWRFKADKCTIKQGFEIDVPTVASQIVEIDEDKQQYFVLNDDFSSEFNFNETVMQADRVALLWDASKSREIRNEKDMQIIKTYVQKLSNIVIDLIVFRDASEELVTFKLVNGNASPLIEYLNKIPYIGGSNLGQLSVTKTVPVQIKDGEEIVISDTYNYYLMFTDGLHNLSLNSTPEKLEAPVYIFSSSTLSDGTLLKVWARKSGGEYFDLNSTTSSTAEIVSKLGNTKFQYLFAEIDGAVVSEIYPSLPSPISSKQFTISGKINGQNTATIALNYGYGTRVTRRMKFQINPSSALKNNLAARYWAQKKIDELQLFPEVAENEAKILSIGQQYNIVTPNSSLIVLESLDQYVKYEIEPPKSLPEVRRNYLEIMKNRKQQQVERDNEKILSVVGFWQRRVAWWNEDVTSPEHSEPQIQHHFQFGFFKPDVHQVAPKDVIDLKQADLTDVLQQQIVEDEEKAAEQTIIVTHSETDRLISERDDEIKLIEQQISQVNDIFRDLKELTEQQSCMIDRIESNVENAQYLASPDMGLVDHSINLEVAMNGEEDYNRRGGDDLDMLLADLELPEEPAYPSYADDPLADLLSAAAAAPKSPTMQYEYPKSEEEEDEAVGYGGLFDDGVAASYQPYEEEVRKSSPNPYADPSPVVASASAPTDMPDLANFDTSFLMDYDNDGEGGGGNDFSGFTYVPEPAPKVEPSKTSLKKQAKSSAKSGKKEEKAAVFKGLKSKDMERPKPTNTENQKTEEAKPMSVLGRGPPPPKEPTGKKKPSAVVSKPPSAPAGSIVAKNIASSNNNNNNNIDGNMPIPPPPMNKSMPYQPQMQPSMPPQSMPGLPYMAAPGGYPTPAAAPMPYPTLGAYPSVPAPILAPLAPSNSQERFRTISTRRPSASEEKMDRAKSIAKETEYLAGETLEILRDQKQSLDDISRNISEANESVSHGVSELRQAESYQKKSWFSSLGQDIGGFIGGKRKAKAAPTMATTLPTIGFNAAPASVERESSRSRRQLRTVQQRIDDVKEVMANNIEKVLSRGDRLESIVDRTEDLQAQSYAFKKTSARLKRKEFGCGGGSCLFLILVPFILLFKFIIWTSKRVKKVMNNSEQVYQTLGNITTITYYEPAVRTVTDPVYVTLTLPAAPVESPSDEYFGTLLKAQDEVQTQLNTAAAPEPESDTTVNKTEKVDPKTVWTNWHARQAQTWKEFEQKHFTTGLCFMQKWNEVRVGQLQRVLERELKLIDEEFNSTKTDLAFYKGDERKTASREVRQKWKSREFYMTAIEALENLGDSNIHAQVLAIQKREHVHEKLSSFYIDVAQFLFGRGRIHEGATVLSTLAEIDFENPQLLRAMAMNTDHIPQLDRMTEALYRQILKLRPDEPQSYTDLAAVLARRIFRTIKGNTATSTRDSKLLATANEAMELYRQVIIKKWDVRWCQVELTALSEMSRLGHFVQWMGLDQSSMVNIDRRLVQSMMDLDLHVMIRWDTDLTDMEIVVTEPSGEVCNSFHNKTKTGMLSRNFTCGYGPQEYCCRTAQPGRYKIEVRLYGAPPAAPPTTVTVRVTTDWGRPVTQVEEYHVVRLNKVKETVHIMDVNFKAL